MTHPNNRRRNNRVRKKLIIKYGTSKKNFSSISLTENISLSGVYFLSLEPIAIGKLLFCSISSLKNKKNIELEARAVRLELVPDRLVPTYGVGIEFISLSITERNLLNYILEI